MTDEVDTFADACGRPDAAKADKSTSTPTPELTNEVVINLAGLTPLQYAQQLAREAKKYKTPVKLLEKAVEAIKIEKEAEKLLEPHWDVTPADEPVDAAKLFADMEAQILHHVAMPKHLAYVVALWIGQSWIHEHATYSPILFVTSAERDSGKSTLMGVVSFIVRRSLLSVGISAAALYRSIERWHPTFVIDEADEAFVDNPDLRQVINSGWTRGQGVVRCDPDTNEPRKLPITEKGIASLLHEYGIFSRQVGPKDRRSKGYRKADFADAWNRYLPPKVGAPPEDPDNLPFTRTPLRNDNAFGDKSAVHRERGEREKVDGFSNNTKAVNGRTGEKPGIAPFLEISADSDPADDGLDLPPSLRRCLHCNGTGEVNAVALPDRTVWLHRE